MTIKPLVFLAMTKKPFGGFSYDYQAIWRILVMTIKPFGGFSYDYQAVCVFLNMTIKPFCLYLLLKPLVDFSYNY